MYGTKWYFVVHNQSTSFQALQCTGNLWIVACSVQSGAPDGSGGTRGERVHASSGCSELPEDVARQAWPWPSLVMGIRLSTTSVDKPISEQCTTARCEALLLIEVGLSALCHTYLWGDLQILLGAHQ
jgi:hypothetical protein